MVPEVEHEDRRELAGVDPDVDLVVSDRVIALPQPNPDHSVLVRRSRLEVPGEFLPPDRVDLFGLTGRGRIGRGGTGSHEGHQNY